MSSTQFNIDLHNQPVVIDNGSCVLKAGLSGDSKPKVFEFNVIGKISGSKTIPSSINRDKYIGNEAQRLRSILNLEYPFTKDRIENWDDMEDIWNYLLLTRLEIQNIREHPVLLTETLVGNIIDRNKMCEIFYEKFGSPALYFSNEFLLSLYGTGRTTGCVVASGHSFSGVSSIIEGVQIPSSVKINKISGRAVTEFMASQLQKHYGLVLNTQNDLELVRALKEKCCFLSPNITCEKQKYQYFDLKEEPSKFKLPDGNILSIQREKSDVPEIIFDPQLFGSKEPSLQDMVMNSISQGGIEAYSQLSKSIIFAGGTTLLPGFGSRLLNELSSVTHNKTEFKIYASRERRYICWLGGSILTGLSTMRHLWTTKEQWDERKETAFSR